MGWSAAVKALQKVIDSTQKAQKTVAAKAAKLPSGSSARSTTIESDLAGTQTASQNRLQKLIARRDAQKTFENAQSAERAANAAIRLGGAEPIGMTRRLAEFVGLLHVRRVNPADHAAIAPYGTENWPDYPGELFADYYELSRTRPAFLRGVDAEIARFFDDPIGVKNKAVKKGVDAWIKARS